LAAIHERQPVITMPMPMPMQFSRTTVEIIHRLAVVHERIPGKGNNVEPECICVTRGHPSDGGSCAGSPPVLIVPAVIPGALRRWSL
jgi:hypothetical protein